VFISSHSISELEKVSDKVFIMVQGELVRTVVRAEWEGSAGGLEDIFVRTVQGGNARAGSIPSSGPGGDLR